MVLEIAYNMAIIAYNMAITLSHSSVASWFFVSYSLKIKFQLLVQKHAGKKRCSPNHLFYHFFMDFQNISSYEPPARVEIYKGQDQGIWITSIYTIPKFIKS